MAFTKAVAASELKPGDGRCVELEGKRIAVFNVGATFYAVDDVCTHDNASLAEGFVMEEDGVCKVECPWHGALFDLKSGAALTLPAVKPVKAYPTRVTDGQVEVDL
jgi:3-phenylpropionate/trans-cinnamate dioxygenase ferredoxin component